MRLCPYTFLGYPKLKYFLSSVVLSSVVCLTLPQFST